MKTKKITAIILAAMMTLTTAACVAGCELTNVTKPSGISVVSGTTEDTSDNVTSDTSDTSFESTEASTVETEASTAISADVTAESTDATTKQTETTRQTQATTRETTRTTSAPTQATQRQATPTPKPTQQTQATQHQATPTPKPTNTPTPTPKPTNTPTPKPANLHATADVYWSSSGYYETLDDEGNVVRTEHNFDGWVRGVTVHRASENKRWQIDDATDDEVWRQVQAAGGSHYGISIKNVRDQRP